PLARLALLPPDQAKAVGLARGAAGDAAELVDGQVLGMRHLPGQIGGQAGLKGVGHAASNRTGRCLGPLTKAASLIFGSPSSSSRSIFGSSSSQRIRISSLARCWPRQTWAP